MTVYGHFIITPNWKPKRFLAGEEDKQTMVHPYSGILLSNKKNELLNQTVA